VLAGDIISSASKQMPAACLMLMATTNHCLNKSKPAATFFPVFRTMLNFTVGAPVSNGVSEMEVGGWVGGWMGEWIILFSICKMHTFSTFLKFQ
jgi:hypothetical protein